VVSSVTVYGSHTHTHTHTHVAVPTSSTLGRTQHLQRCCTWSLSLPGKCRQQTSRSACEHSHRSASSGRKATELLICRITPDSSLRICCGSFSCCLQSCSSQQHAGHTSAQTRPSCVLAGCQRYCYAAKDCLLTAPMPFACWRSELLLLPDCHVTAASAVCRQVAGTISCAAQGLPVCCCICLY
jgi:hypothetical protein